MKVLLLAVLTVTLAACGNSSAAGPSATPASPGTPTVMKFPHHPAMLINPNHSYTATVVTNDGTFTIQLLPKIAPITVNNFVFLARHHYYDNNQFTRVIKNFMIQTGDPTGTGQGNPGYSFNDEIHPKLKYAPGTVAMANHGPNTNGSQFFIVTGLQAQTLPPNYTIFGRVIKNSYVVAKIAGTPVGPNVATQEISQPLTDVYMKTVTINGSP